MKQPHRKLLQVKLSAVRVSIAKSAMAVGGLCLAAGLGFERVALACAGGGIVAVGGLVLLGAWQEAKRIGEERRNWEKNYAPVILPLKVAFVPLIPSDAPEASLELRLLTAEGKPTGYRYRIVDRHGNPTNVRGSPALEAAVAQLNAFCAQADYPITQFLFEGKRAGDGWNWEVIPVWRS